MQLTEIKQEILGTGVLIQPLFLRKHYATTIGWSSDLESFRLAFPFLGNSGFLRET